MRSFHRDSMELSALRKAFMAMMGGPVWQRRNILPAHVHFIGFTATPEVASLTKLGVQEISRSAETGGHYVEFRPGPAGFYSFAACVHDSAQRMSGAVIGRSVSNEFFLFLC